MKYLFKIMDYLKSTKIIKIFLNPIKFLIDFIYLIESAILNILRAITDSIFNLSKGIRNNFSIFFQTLFHTESDTWNKLVLSIGRYIIFPFKALITKVKTFETEYERKREIRKTIKTIKRATLSTKTLALNTAFSYLVKICTIFLQVVSFVTTYQGIDYYFGDIFKYSTLFITLVVQGSLLVLANAAVNKQRFTRSRFIMLMVFMVISITFSYTGLMNSHISPEEEYKKNYKEFYNSYQELYEEIAAESSFSEEFGISEITAKIENIVNFSNDQIAQLQNDLDRLYYNYYNGIEVERTQNEIYTISRQIAAIANYREELESVQIMLPNIVQNKDSALILQEMNNNEKTNYGNVKMKYDNLHNYLKTIVKDVNMGELPDNLGVVYQKYLNGKTLHEKKNVCRDYDTLKDEAKKSFKVFDSTYSTNMSRKSEELNKITSLLKNEVQNNFINNSLMQSVKTVKPNEYEDVKEKANKVMNSIDVNLLAIGKLIPESPDFMVAFVILIQAIFVDGMTVLMPIMIEKQRNSLLYAKSRKDLIYEEEDIFEELLINYDLEKNQDTSDIIKNFNNLLYEFKKILHPIPQLEDTGFIMYIKKEDFEHLLKGELMEFCVFCEECTYIQYTPQEILNILLRERNSSNSFYAEYDVYLVKEKLIIWMKQNFKALKKI